MVNFTVFLVLSIQPFRWFKVKLDCCINFLQSASATFSSRVDGWQVKLLFGYQTNFYSRMIECSVTHQSHAATFKRTPSYGK